MGHVPRKGVEGIERFCEGGQGARRVKGLALATGQIILAYEQAWTQRVKTTLAWEQGNRGQGGGGGGWLAGRPATVAYFKTKGN